MVNGKRLLFFDLLRIIAVAGIVYLHIHTFCPWVPFYDGGKLFNILQMNSGVIGVYLLIFVSGAVLEYTHSHLEGIEEISTFYVKRLFRVYPAFWMSMVIGLVLAPALIYRPLFDTFLEFTGFHTWSGEWGGGPINPVGWFIGLIVVLYFLFPFISSSIRKYPYLMLFLIAFVEISIRYTFNIYQFPMLGAGTDRWLPVCNLLEFGLGIWIVQRGFYPKWTYDNPMIGFIADISFYVFLIHIVSGMKILMTASLPFYFTAVVMLAWLLMLGDQKIQAWLKKSVGI